MNFDTRQTRREVENGRHSEVPFYDGANCLGLLSKDPMPADPRDDFAYHLGIKLSHFNCQPRRAVEGIAA